MDHARLTIVLSTRPTSAVLGQEKTGQIQNTAAYCLRACAAGVWKGRARVAAWKAASVPGSEGPKTNPYLVLYNTHPSLRKS